MHTQTRSGSVRLFLTVLTLLTCLFVSPQGAQAQVTAFKQAVAEAASDDRDLAQYYREADYKGLWTGRGSKDASRRKALFAALADVDAHGLSARRYDTRGLLAQMRAAKTPRDLGMTEVALS